jgi:uncharacterized repeat protein (TIGR01451 family)
VDETAESLYEFAGATCHVMTVNGELPSVTFDHLPAMLHVAGNESAICMFRNTLVRGPSGPPMPPPECGDVDTGAPECPSTGGPEGNGPGGTSPSGNGPGEGPGGGIARATTLTVTKTLPRHAHVGQRVPVTITVRNVGAHTARNVTVHESPPGAGHLVGVSGAHVTRHPDGTVLVRLGNLQPGASVTAQAKMLIVPGAGGPLQNTVSAAAQNADVVLATAVVRVPVAHAPGQPSPPRVTG